MLCVIKVTWKKSVYYEGTLHVSQFKLRADASGQAESIAFFRSFTSRKRDYLYWRNSSYLDLAHLSRSTFAYNSSFLGGGVAVVSADKKICSIYSISSSWLNLHSVVKRKRAHIPWNLLDKLSWDHILRVTFRGFEKKMLSFQQTIIRIVITSHTFICKPLTNHMWNNEFPRINSSEQN